MKYLLIPLILLHISLNASSLFEIDRALRIIYHFINKKNYEILDSSRIAFNNMNQTIGQIFEEIGLDKDRPLRPETRISISGRETTLDQVEYDGMETNEKHISLIFLQLREQNIHIKLPLGIREFDNKLIPVEK